MVIIQLTYILQPILMGQFLFENSIYKKILMSNKRKYHRAKIDSLDKNRLQNIGGLIREYRFSTLLSRQDFAKENGISKSLIERVEKGKNITLHTLFRVCDGLNISLEDIFENM